MRRGRRSWPTSGRRGSRTGSSAGRSRSRRAATRRTRRTTSSRSTPTGSTRSFPRRRRVGRRQPDGGKALDFFVQQVVNGLTLGGVYALIALGYSLVYGVLRLLNFAHGDVFMIGG